MVSIPFALSVHHFISSVGADAGFASLIGLALLVLLYFAHARETATLRSRADEAGLRVQELEAQVADLADQIASLPAEISVRAAGARVAATPAGVQQRTAAGVGAPGTGHAPLAPAAPAGMGAPALAAATRLIPWPDAQNGAPESAPAVAAGSNGSSRVPVAAGTGAMERPVQAPAGPGGRPPAGPGRAGGGPGGPGQGGVHPRPISGQPRPVSAQGRPGGGGRPSGPVMPMRPGPKRSGTGRVIAAVLVAALAVAAVVVAVILVTHKGGSSTTASKSSSALSSSVTRHRTAVALVRPSTVTVSVLNGTDQAGLAGRISDKLHTDGFPKGAVTNAQNQSETTSTVAYLTAADRVDALAVASKLKLSSSAVRLVDATTKSIACSNNPSGCSSPVYVTVGSDLAGLQ